MTQDPLDITSSEIDDELRDAAESGKLAKVLELLDRGGNLNVKGADGDSLLHIAAADGHTEVCELLIDRGIPVDIRSDDGWTALMTAAYWNHEQTFDSLLARGADLHALNKKGQTAYGLSFNNMQPVMPLHIAKLGCSLTDGDLDVRQAKPYAGLSAIEVAARGGLESDLITMLAADEPWPTSNGVQGLRDLAEQSGSAHCVAIVDAHRASQAIRDLARRRSPQP